MPISYRLFRLGVKHACDACDSEPIGMDVSEKTVGWCSSLCDFIRAKLKFMISWLKKLYAILDENYKQHP